MDLKERITAINNKYGKIIALVEIALYIGFGFLAGYVWDKRNIERECDQFVIDNYYTEEMQLCLDETLSGSFGVPFGEMPEDAEYSVNPGYRPG